MCGLFGFVGRASDPKVLLPAIKRAKQRGPDGMAWFDGQQVRTDSTRDAPLVLGHCRLATSGRVAVLQPLASGPFAITHNGNIRDYRAIADRLDLKCETTVDSELILRLLERDGWAAVLRELPIVPGAIVAVEPAAIHWTANKLPLYLLDRPEGIYWCSTKGEEPDWTPVSHRTVSR